MGQWSGGRVLLSRRPRFMKEGALFNPGDRWKAAGFGLGAQGLMMMMMMMMMLMMLVVGSIWKPIGTFGFGKEDPSDS